MYILCTYLILFFSCKIWEYISSSQGRKKEKNGKVFFENPLCFKIGKEQNYNLSEEEIEEEEKKNRTKVF